MRKVSGSLGVLALVCLGIGHAAADGSIPRLVAALRADHAMVDALAACPADIAPKTATAPGNWPPYDACRANLDACFSTCRTRSTPDLCLALGLLFSDNLSETIERKDVETLFATACAAGAQLGCTNRAAGILFAKEGDPFWQKRPDERHACALRTFRIGCDRKEPWACAMVGTAYEKGEGVTGDPVEAIKFYKMSCALSTYSDAFDQIRPLLERLEKARR